MFENLPPPVMCTLVGAIVCLLVAIWLSLVYWRSKTVPVKYLMIFFWMKTAFLGSFFAGYLIGPSSPELGIFLIKFAKGILHFTLIPLVLLISYFWLPRQKKLFVWIIALGGMTAFIASLFQPAPPTVEAATVRDIIGSFGVWYIFISHLFTMTVMGLAFFILGLKSGNTKLIFRGIFLGLGMVLASTTGGLMALVPLTWLAMCGKLNIIGHIAMGLGIVIQPRRE